MEEVYTYNSAEDEVKTNVEDWEEKQDTWGLEPEVEELNTGGVTRKKHRKNKKAKAKKASVVELQPIDARSKRAIVNKQM